VKFLNYCPVILWLVARRGGDGRGPPRDSVSWKAPTLAASLMKGSKGGSGARGGHGARVPFLVLICRPFVRRLWCRARGMEGHQSGCAGWKGYMMRSTLPVSPLLPRWGLETTLKPAARSERIRGNLRNLRLDSQKAPRARLFFCRFAWRALWDF